MKRTEAADGTVDILAISAHADDIELSCGGTIAAAVAQGQKVGIIDLTGGEMGTRGTPEIRLRESAAAQEILGAEFRETLDFGDGALRTGREEELQLIRLIRKYRPLMVLAPYPEDRHPDHSRAGRLITEASFYAGLKKLDTGQSAHRPQTVAYFLQNYMQTPSFIVDIQHSHETKMKAVAAYESQFYNPESKEPVTWIAKKAFIDMIEARARHFGGMIGSEFGEAFVTRQPPRVSDLVAAYQGREVP